MRKNKKSRFREEDNLLGRCHKTTVTGHSLLEVMEPRIVKTMRGQA